jgi:hypothetical protein
MGGLLDRGSSYHSVLYPGNTMSATLKHHGVDDFIDGGPSGVVFRDGSESAMLSLVSDIRMI